MGTRLISLSEHAGLTVQSLLSYSQGFILWRQIISNVEDYLSRCYLLHSTASGKECVTGSRCTPNCSVTPLPCGTGERKITWKTTIVFEIRQFTTATAKACAHKQRGKKQISTYHWWAMFSHFLGSRASVHVAVAPEGKHCDTTNVPHSSSLTQLSCLSWCYIVWNIPLVKLHQLTWLCPVLGSCHLSAPWWGRGECWRQQWCCVSTAQQ